jgi:hypothetical protein
VDTATTNNIDKNTVEEQTPFDTLMSTKEVNSSVDQAKMSSKTNVTIAALKLVVDTTTLSTTNPTPMHESSKKGSNKLKSKKKNLTTHPLSSSIVGAAETAMASTTVASTGVKNPLPSMMSRNRIKNVFSSNTSDKLSTDPSKKFKDKYESSEDLLSDSSNDNSDMSDWKEGDKDSDAFKKPAARSVLDVAGNRVDTHPQSFFCESCSYQVCLFDWSIGSLWK